MNSSWSRSAFTSGRNKPGILGGKVTGGDQIEGLFEFRIRLIIVARPITTGFNCLHLVGGQTEEEEILMTHLVADFDVRAVQGADGQGPIHGEFHVAGAGGLHPGGGNLLRKVGRRIDPSGRF